MRFVHPQHSVPTVRLLLQTTFYRPSFKDLCLDALDAIVRRSKTACFLYTIIAVVEESNSCKMEQISLDMDVFDRLISAFSYRSRLIYSQPYSEMRPLMCRVWKMVLACNTLHPYLQQSITSALISLAAGTDVCCSLNRFTKSHSEPNFKDLDDKGSKTTFRSRLPSFSEFSDLSPSTLNNCT
ncbi:hypothetical protein GEMRC1_005823 [Eukaryota sp. GEM-RC1]